MGYTSEALFVGRGFDDQIDSLVVTDRGDDEYIFKEDMVELYIDADFDQADYVHAGSTRGGSLRTGTTCPAAGQQGRVVMGHRG